MSSNYPPGVTGSEPEIVGPTRWEEACAAFEEAQGDLRRTPGYEGLCRACHTPVLDSHAPIHVWTGLPVGDADGVIHGTFACQDEPRCPARGLGLRQCLLPAPHDIVGAGHLWEVPRGEVRFSTLYPDGTETNVRSISRGTILACPRVILLPDHYRADGSCRCDEMTCEAAGCSGEKAPEEIFCEAHAEGMGR
jgi:hypothetical protein